jgi:hypothetical protein
VPSREASRLPKRTLPGRRVCRPLSRGRRWPMWPNASSWLALKLLLRGACLVQLVVDDGELAKRTIIERGDDLVAEHLQLFHASVCLDGFREVTEGW